MKKVFILILALFGLFGISNAQIKLHSNGQISFQSTTTTGGVQIEAAGKSIFEPNITASGSDLTKGKVQTPLVRLWTVFKPSASPSIPRNRFYVTGNGDVYSIGQYTIGNESSKGHYPIENASTLLSTLNGYYFDNHDFDGFEPDFIGNPNIAPEAIDGLMKDLNIDKSLGLSVDGLESVLPEAIRHDPDGMVYINYSAVIPVLVEAFKEQQTRIEQLETILKENGLLKP